MQAIVSLAVEIVATLLTFALTNFAILALRNPLRSATLRRHAIAELITGLAVFGILIALTYLGSGIFTLFPNLAVGGVLFILTSLVLYVGIDRAMGMKQRLAACDAGRSPFVHYDTTAQGGMPA